MKKTLLKALPFFFVLIGIWSCDNEPLEGEFGEGPLTPSSGQLVGEWELVSMEADVALVTTLPEEMGGGEMESQSTIEVVNPEYTLNFTETNYTTFGAYDVTISTTVEGESGELTNSLTDISGNGSYTAAGNTLTLSGDSFVSYDLNGVDESMIYGESREAQYQLSDDGQTLTITEDIDQSHEVEGTEVSYTSTATSVWNKISDGTGGEEPTGDIFITFKVNGDTNYTWEPYTASSMKLSIGGEEGENDAHRSISLSLPLDFAEGGYDIGGDPFDAETYTAKYTESDVSADATSGTIEITSVTNEFIEGTFSFETEAGFSITEGSFKAYNIE